MADLVNSNNSIGNGLPASVMRESMEDKNLLANKGSIYVGTGSNNSIVGYNVCTTMALDAGDNNKILRYNSSTTTGFEQIDPATTEDFIANKADKATDSVYAQKIGTSSTQANIGSDIIPVYVSSDGSITECGTYANATKVKLNGVWKNASTAEFYAPTSGATKGSILVANGAGQTAPIWVANGSTDGQVLRWNNSSTLPEWGVSSDLAINNSVYAQKIGTNSTHPNIGDSTQPVYINTLGDVVKASTYAGGTKVTLNNTNKGASTASFYAPIASGNAGNFLVSNGSGKTPEWKSLTANKALVSDANGNISVSSVDSANLSYVANVTSDIQDQLNNRVALTGDQSVSGTKTFTTLRTNATFIQLGKDSSATGQNSSAVGSSAKAFGTSSSAFGDDAQALGDCSIGIGVGSRARGNWSTSIGFASTANTSRSIAIGSRAKVYQNSSVAIGANSNSYHVNSIVLGNNSSTGVSGGDPDIGSIAIGFNAHCDQGGEISIGENSFTSQYYSIAIGADSNGYGTSSIAIGHNAHVGTENTNSAPNTICIGQNSSITSGRENILIGNNSSLSRAYHTIALAHNSSLSTGVNEEFNNIFVGSNISLASKKINNTILLGNSSHIDSGTGSYVYNGIAIGNGSTCRSNNSMAIGSNSKCTGANSTSIGYNAVLTSSNSIRIGSSVADEYQHLYSICPLDTSSDSRLKNIECEANTSLCLENVLKLPIKRYTFKDFTGKHYDEHQIGWIADDVEKVFPKSVSYINTSYKRNLGNGEFEEIEIENEKNINFYTTSTPILWGAIQELSKLLDQSNEKIAELEQRIATLEAK